MQFRQRSALTQGFSLLEMAIVLLIIGGSVSVFVSTSRQVAQPSNCLAETKDRIETIRATVEQYMREQNRYPAPASRAAGSGSASYGQEAAGSDIDSYANGGNPILFGALPFQALGLPSSLASDCWGNQFSYIVTAALTTSASNSPNLPPQGYLNPATMGGLNIRSGKASSYTVLLSNAAYAVVSHGASGRNAGNGAVSTQHRGTHGWCTNNLPLDHENCNLTDAVLYDASLQDGENAGVDFYDDLLVFARKASVNCNATSYPVNWTVGPNNCTGTMPGPVANTAHTLVATNSAGRTGSATFACDNGVPKVAADTAPSCSAVPVVNGTCGSAQGHAFQLLPTINLCASGTATIVNETSTLFSWTCSGAGGGMSSGCSATPVCKCGGITLICTNPRNPFGGINLLGINILC